MTVWTGRAERLLEQALDDARSGVDAIPTATAALAALRIEAGEMPATELDGYPFPGEDEDPAGCICPPDLLARGGFRGGCLVHGGMP